MKLLTENNAKILKGRDKGYIIYGLHLLPGRVCARATTGCLKACLNTSGRGRYRNTQEARARKTDLFLNHPDIFLARLRHEISMLAKRAYRKGYTPAFRLNLTSDIPWETYSIPQEFSNIIFYDYTKYHDRHPPSNYHLTFSRSESLQNHIYAKEWLARGGNVAVVFRTEEFPKVYWNHKVIVGDANDLRFLDPKPRIIALKAKGRGRLDKTNFVV